jgi:hypothetical protein
MAKHESVTEKQAAERLLSALDQPEDMHSAELRDLIPALVNAEQAGEHVASDPRFAALLLHLEHCEECLEIYEQLSIDLEALISEEEQPQLSRPAPNFFEPVRRTEKALLRIIRDVKERIELALTIPQLAPVGMVLGDSTDVLFRDQLAELPGHPLVVVALELSADTPIIRVAVRESAATRRWEIQARLGDQSYSVRTDERGIAAISGFTIEQLRQAGSSDVIFVEVHEATS